MIVLTFIKHKKQFLKEYAGIRAGRKIVVFGTGSLFQKMKYFFDIDVENDVKYFVESSPNNNMFLGKELVSLESLTNFLAKDEKDFVLVCSSAWSEIKETINQNLLDNHTWYAPYNEMNWVFNKDDLPIVELKENIQKLLLEYEGKLLEVHRETIAILVGERNGYPSPYHAITLGVLLRLKGLNVHFLFNDLSKFGELNRGNGFGAFQNEILENLVIKASEKYGIPYEKMSEQSSVELTESEMKKVKQFIYYNKIWHSKKVTFDEKDKELNERAASWLSNAMLTKGFLNKHHFDKVYVWTGVHSEWAALRILAEEKDIKIYSSEYARSGYSFSLSGPTVFQKDSTLINHQQLNKEQLEKLANFTNQHVNEKFPKNQTRNRVGTCVLIPLNIFWDSAAFNINDLFIYFDQWLEKTVRFLIDKCKVHVYVRQHPNELKHGTGKDVEKLLKGKFGDSKYFHFINATSTIDTYSLIKKAQLVLPNTSTVGVEAAMLGKQVIVKNEVYYANLGFVKKANTEREYFEMIQETLSSPKKLSNEQIEEAKFCYFMTMLNSTDTFFGHSYKDVKIWSTLNLEEVLNNESVQWLLDLLINDNILLSNKL